MTIEELTAKVKAQDAVLEKVAETLDRMSRGLVRFGEAAKVMQAELTGLHAVVREHQGVIEKIMEPVPPQPPTPRTVN